MKNIWKKNSSSLILALCQLMNLKNPEIKFFKENNKEAIFYNADSLLKRYKYRIHLLQILSERHILYNIFKIKSLKLIKRKIMQ